MLAVVQRLHSQTILILGTFSILFGARQSEPNLQALYENHQWLELQMAVTTAHGRAPLFYRGAVEAAFDAPEAAQRDLDAVIRASPEGPDAAAAHDLLTGLYFRLGDYRKALAHVNARTAAHPDAEGSHNALPLLEALSSAPGQTMEQRRSTTVPLAIEDGNGVLPVTINGHDAHYIFDTGANISTISESEADRLGLETREVGTTMSGMIGAGGVRAHVAVAEHLALGDIHLTHVAFVVVADTQPPFNDLPTGRRGILGIQVLMAVQTMRWSPHDKTFACGFAPPALDPRQSVVFFDGTTPMTQVEFQQRPITMGLDTGAQDTELYPPFARAFAVFVNANGRKESHQLTGLDGSAAYDALLIDALTLRVGGRDLALRPAHVLLKESNGASHWAFGNLGMDLMNQAQSVTLDLSHMRLSLR